LREGLTNNQLILPKEKIMKKNQKETGDLANAAAKVGETITIKGRGKARIVSTSYDAFKRQGDKKTADNIANHYVGTKGQHHWEKKK
jgi:hypothetical protein